MKVKVNGSWVDVPAFKVVEKVGDVAVLEGDITLTSGSQTYIDVTHNLGVLPIFASIGLVGGTDVTWRPYASYIAPPHFGAREYLNSASVESFNVLKIDGGTNAYYPKADENMLRFTGGSTDNKFLAGTYHYKIYYNI